jgi:hypothetical protein
MEVDERISRSSAPAACTRVTPPQGRQKAGGRWHYWERGRGGGDVRLCWAPPRPSMAPSQGRRVPIHTLPLLRSSRTVRRGNAVSDKNHPSRPPVLPTQGAQGRRIWEEPRGAREHPFCAEGWAMWALGRWPDLPVSHPGVPPSWGSRPSRPEPSGRASSWGV